MRIRRVASDLVLIEQLDESVVAAAAPRLRAQLWPGVEDVIGAWDVLGVYGQPTKGWEDWIAGALKPPAEFESRPALVIQVAYELGEDIREVAKSLDLSIDHLVKLHSETEVVCRAIGFQPGFGYLGPVHSALVAVLRRSSPRSRVDSGSVGLAGGHTAIYPQVSPGGWQLIGRTKAVMCNPQKEFFALRVGDRVRFELVKSEQFESEPPYAPVRMWLSADVGEGCEWEEQVLEHVSAVNIGLGEHAGSPEQTRLTIRRASERGCLLGMHPGYPDRLRFGRRPPTGAEKRAWVESVINQMVNWQGAAAWDYLKFHGALFHDIGRGEVGICDALALTVTKLGLPLVGLPSDLSRQFAERCGVAYWPEGYAERGMHADGRLIQRGESGAELTDLSEICQQAVAVADRGAKLICIHGDRPDAPKIAAAVHRALMQQGVWVEALEPASR